jgi:uncharacterized protein (TIGR02145 family)
MGGSKSDSILVVVKGINQAPSFTLSSTSIQLQNYNRDSLLVRIVSAETTNDTAQYILERRIDLIGSPLDSVLSSKPTLDAQGTLHLPRLPNPRGWFTFRITIKDNGGTENGGIDSATKDLKIFFSDTIIDGGDKNVYHYLVLGKLSWFRENLRRQPKWGPLYSDSNGVMYEWAQAFDADSVNCRYSGDCALEKSGANLQGLCPAGWNIPADMQWESLVKWAAQGGADSSGATRLRSRIGWNWFQYMGAIFNAPGTDDWGFGVRPNYYYGNAGDPMTGGSGRYWASAFANTPDPTSSTYGRFFADFSVTGSERNGYWNTFTVWGMDAQRYFQTYSVRCVRNAPPGQW